MKKNFLAAILATAVCQPVMAAEQARANNVYPSKAELQTLRDTRDLQGATQAYLWSMSIATTWAWADANFRVADWNDFVTYKDPHQKRHIITSNMATPYAVAYLNLADFDGLAYIDVPAGPTGGIINDLQMRHIADIGLAGDDRGKGATYLVVGPNAQVPEKHNADYVIHSKTNVMWAGTRVLAQDPTEISRLLNSHKFYRYGETADKALGKVVNIGDTEYRGWNLRGMAHWEELHKLIQLEDGWGPEDAMALEFLKRVGIEKGKPFEPTARQKKILLEAEKLGFEMSTATSAGRIYDPQLMNSRYYPNKNWSTILNLTNYDQHIDPDNGAMQLDARLSYSHEAYSMSKGMTAKIVGVGSKYLAAYEDSNGEWLNGRNDYQLVVPANVPAKQFWSLVAYDAARRAMVETDQKGLGSRNELVYNDDGSVTLTLSAQCEQFTNCIKLEDNKDFFVYFRWYAPTEAFFDKSWQLPEIEKLN